MKQDHIVTAVSMERWKAAQESEARFAKSEAGSGDDYNTWWAKNFNNYEDIAGMRFDNVLEVGCGPHTNVRIIRPKVFNSRLFLEDPLIREYLNHRQILFWKKTPLQTLAALPSTEITSHPLENLPYRDGMMDLVICINVLDHVSNFPACMYEMNRVLSKGGVIVIGQDLTNATDFEECPETMTDVGHPIKVDLQTLGAWTLGYGKLFERVLSREEGRNPRCHYATYLGILQKPILSSVS